MIVLFRSADDVISNKRILAKFSVKRQAISRNNGGIPTFIASAQIKLWVSLDAS